jgi:hypothetical protein
MAFINSPPPTISGLSTTQLRKGSSQAAMQGLSEAAPTGLGDVIGLQQRANADAGAYRQGEMAAPDAVSNLQYHMPIPGFQPQGFDAVLQGIKENAPGGIMNPDRRGDPMRGLPTAPLGQPSTMFAPGQESAVTGQIYDPTTQALQALKRTYPGRGQ